MSRPSSVLRQRVGRCAGSAGWVGTALLVLASIAFSALASAQGTPNQQPASPTISQPPTPPGTANGSGAEAPTDRTSDTAAGPSTPPTVTSVSVDSTGGPLTLPEDVQSAAAAWREAVPDLVNLSVATAGATRTSQDGDRIVFADPGIMGPDTLSLGLRLQGSKGIEVRLAPQAYRAHPSVLLHELGVFLGLPEGGVDGVMAFGVPAVGELTAPAPADVAALRERLRFSPEDLTRDGVVDFDDLVVFGQAYGSVGLNLPADFDGDGAVGPSDLERLRAVYAFTLPSDAKPAPEENQGTGTSPQGADGAPSGVPDASGSGTAPGVTPAEPPATEPPATAPPDQDVTPPAAPSDGG